MCHIHRIVSFVGLWGALGGDKDVLLASTITHSIAASIYLVVVILACVVFCCCLFSEREDCIFAFLLFILAVIGAVLSGLLYNSDLKIDINTTTTSPFNL